MDPKDIPATPQKVTPKDILEQRKAATKVIVPSQPQPAKPAVVLKPAAEDLSALAINKEQSENVLLEVGLFIKKHGFSHKSLKFAAAYLCAKAPEIFGYDLKGKDLEDRVAVQVSELVEKYDHLVPIFASWIDLPWTNLVQRQLERYAVRTGYEWMKAFELKFGRLPASLETDFKLLAA